MTKFVCAIGSGLNDLRVEARFDTTTPAEMMAHMIEFLQQQESLFEPIRRNRSSRDGSSRLSIIKRQENISSNTASKKDHSHEK